MGTTSSLLQSFSNFSTETRCDNCKIMLDEVRWKQCPKCRNFDLCHSCAEGDSLTVHITDPEKCHPNPEYGKDMHLNRQYDEDNHYARVRDVETHWRTDLEKRQKSRFDRLMSTEKPIANDYDMSDVMGVLENNGNNIEPKRSELGSKLVQYHAEASQRKIRVLSLDGGGVRGFMSIKVLSQLIKDKYLPDIELPDRKDKAYRKKSKEYQEKLSEYQVKFKTGQDKFTSHFDYFAGTSTGGLIAFCLATGYPLLEIQTIYEKPNVYFTRNWFTRWYFLGLGYVMWAKYNDKKIHSEIDGIIEKVFEKVSVDGKKLTAANATLLDLHNLFNDKHKIDNASIERSRQDHGNSLEFVDNASSTTHDAWTKPVEREKVLLINAYNTTTSSITVFNTSYAEHWRYRVADVLKATMAAPTYFRPWTMYKGKIEDGNFVQDNSTQGVFIDGGVFANDPELTALWAIRMQWKKMVNYRFLSIGTGCYSPQLSSNTWGGYYAWLFKPKKQGLVADTLMDATRSLTETIMTNLAKLDNIKRMKFNYKLKQSLSLDDPKFPDKFKKEWDKLRDEKDDLSDKSRGVSKDELRYGLRYGPDYEALVYFYERYIREDEEKPIGMEQK